MYLFHLSVNFESMIDILITTAYSVISDFNPKKIKIYKCVIFGFQGLLNYYFIKKTLN